MKFWHFNSRKSKSMLPDWEPYALNCVCAIGLHSGQYLADSAVNLVPQSIHSFLRMRARHLRSTEPRRLNCLHPAFPNEQVVLE